MRLKRYLVLAALAAFFISPAQAAFQFGDIICETTATTGTGTINLAGAVTNYQTFISQITSGNTVPYHIVSGDGKIETGIGTFTDATPDTLSRTAYWSSDGSATALSLTGTSTVCVGPTTQIWTGGASWAMSIGTAGTFTTGTVELGAASDTTLSRSGAGEVQVEGVDIVEVNDSPTLGTITTTGNIELGAATDTTIARSAAGEATIEGDAIWNDGNRSVTWMVAASDEVTNIAAGTGKVFWRMPYAFTVTAVGCSLSVAQTAGTLVTVDLNEGDADAGGGNPVSILGTKITIDNSESSSAFAATAATITDTAIAANAEMSIDIDAIGTALAKGLKCWITGHQ